MNRSRGCAIVALFLVLLILGRLRRPQPEDHQTLQISTPPDSSSPFLPPPPSCSANRLGTVQFIHIPKAGGTSIQESLKTWAYRNNWRVALHDNDGPTYETKSDPRGLYLGHRGYGFSSKVLGTKPFTIVVLREPVSRLVSLYDYIVSQSEGAGEAFEQIKTAWLQVGSLDDVVESYNRTWSVEPESLNPGGKASMSDRALHRVLRSQSQYLCGYDCVWFMTGDPREQLFEFPADDETYRRARDNLETIDCVAVLTHVDDLLVQLKPKLTFVPKDIISFPHDNKVAPSRKSKPSAVNMALLREFLTKEIELYERAKVLAKFKTEKPMAGC